MAKEQETPYIDRAIVISDFTCDGDTAITKRLCEKSNFNLGKRLSNGEASLGRRKLRRLILAQSKGAICTTLTMTPSNFKSQRIAIDKIVLG
jgi:hypothetical protein